MSTRPQMDESVRAKIMSDPDVVLDDLDVMRVLISAKDSRATSNVIDLRSIAMERLEARLGRLEDTHRSVIAAAYENLAGTNQIHRAILRMMDATRFETFLRDLTGEVADTLRVDAMQLILESEHYDDRSGIESLSDVLQPMPIGTVDDYITQGRHMSVRPVTLRQVAPGDDSLYGARGAYIHSEACLKLDFGPGCLPGMLLMGSEDPHQFTPQQGTDLLTFFAGVFERAMRRWLT